MAETEMPILTRSPELAPAGDPSIPARPSPQRHPAPAGCGLRERLEEANRHRGAARRPAPGDKAARTRLWLAARSLNSTMPYQRLE